MYDNLERQIDSQERLNAEDCYRLAVRTILATNYKANLNSVAEVWKVIR